MIIAHAIRRLLLTDGGPVRTTIDLLDCLHHRGHEARLISSMPRDLPGHWLQGRGPQVFTVSTRFGLAALAPPHFTSAIRSALRDVQFLHLHVPWDPLNYQIARVARSMGVPYCVSCRGTLDDWALRQKWFKKRIYLSLFARPMLNASAFVHCTSEQEANESRRHAPSTTFRVIPNLIDLGGLEPVTPEAKRMVRHELDLEPASRIILFLSRVFPGKGADLLVEALPAILQHEPMARLVIAGPGHFEYIQRLKARMQTLGISSKVRFAGMVEGRMKSALYGSADVFGLPSEHENFGNVLFEAAAQGAAIVTSRHVALWRELEAGAGARVTELNPASLSAEILSVLRTGEIEAAARRQRTSNWARTFLDRDRIVALYERAYHESVAAHGIPGSPRNVA